MANNNLKIVLIACLPDPFVIDLISKIKSIPGVNFSHLINVSTDRFVSHPKSRAAAQAPSELPRWEKYCDLRSIKRFIGDLFLFPKIENNPAASTFLNIGINIHHLNELDTGEGFQLLNSLGCDLLILWRIGKIPKSILGIPKIGTMKLHQFDPIKGGEKEVKLKDVQSHGTKLAVTIHLVKKECDRVDTIIQKEVPLLDSDSMDTIQKRLNEVSLDLFPDAIRRFLISNDPASYQKSYPQSSKAENSRLESNGKFPKRKKNRIPGLGAIRQPLKVILFLITISVIYLRDLYLTKIRKKNILSVLYYHRVTNICQDGMTTSISEFEWQIRFLKKWYTIISASDLMEWINGSPRFKGKKGILLTFDDGYLDNYVNAFPILKKYGCPAIFFVSTGFIENAKQFGHDKEVQPLIFFEKMTWAQLKEVLLSNIEVGVHSDSHISLAKIPLPDAVQEIETSIAKYESFLTKKPDFMSFPFGKKCDISQELVNYVKQGGQIKALFSAYGNKNISPLNRWDIKRINIGSQIKGIVFLAKVEGGFQTLIKPYEK